jgi:adenine deaminase
LADTSLGDKRTQKLSRNELKRVLSVARGESPADLLLKNVAVLDLVCGDLMHTNIAISGNTIAGLGDDYLEAEEVRDLEGLTAVPGFIDGHLHVESSLMHPFEFERLTLPLGTTAAICDPHEITNVMGDRGYSWFLRCAEQMDQHLFVQTSSCVPALPGFETNGGEFPLEHMVKYRQHPNVLGLAEMMNFPGVVNGDDAVLDKLEAFSGMNIDGHCPMVRGKWLNAYIAAGIQNCHETVTPDEGREKLQKGMALIIREGSVAKNLRTLAGLVTEFNSPQCFLCTDDRNPYEIFNEGHINYMVRLLIQEIGLPMHVAYRLASFSAAKNFGLNRLGLIAPGKRADIVLLNDPATVDIAEVLIGGKRVSELDLGENIEDKLEDSEPPRGNTIVREKLSATDFEYGLKPGRYNVIEIIRGEIITNHLKPEFDGQNFDQDDIVPIVNVERYGNQRKPALGLVRGSGLQRGAIACSVAHDSHNLMAIGINGAEIAFALNSLIETGGGFCAVEGGEVKSMLPLPIAGLLSLKPAEEISAALADLKVACRALGITLDEPFLQMAFLALPVIPSLKITDRGLVDVTKFEFAELRI